MGAVAGRIVGPDWEGPRVQVADDIQGVPRLQFALGGHVGVESSQRSKKGVAVLVQPIEMLTAWDDDPYKAAVRSTRAVQLEWPGTANAVD